MILDVLNAIKTTVCIAINLNFSTWWKMFALLKKLIIVKRLTMEKYVTSVLKITILIL